MFSDLIGALGTAMIITSYFRIQTGRTEPTSLEYSVTNGAGAAFVLISLWFDFNLASFILEAFWLTISVYGTYRWFRAQDRPATACKSA